MEVNQKELASCLGVSSRRIRQLKEDGLFSLKENQRKYNLEKCLQEYIDYKVNAETGRRTSISKEEVQAEHEEVKKQISLLRLRKLRRELHEAADVEAFLSDMLIRFRHRLLALPPKIAMELSGESDLNQMIQTIQKELLNAMEELSEYNPDEIDGLGETDMDADEMEEDEEDDIGEE